MTRFEQLNKDLMDAGFVIEGEDYTFTKVHQQRMYINGREVVKNHEQVLKMTFIGSSFELDENGMEVPDTELYGFDIYDGDAIAQTIYVEDFEDFVKYINM